MVNLAIIGTGGIARGGHGAAFQQAKSAQLWSVCSRDISRAENFAREFGAKSPTCATA